MQSPSLPLPLSLSLSPALALLSSFQAPRPLKSPRGLAPKGLAVDDDDASKKIACTTYCTSKKHSSLKILKRDSLSFPRPCLNPPHHLSSCPLSLLSIACFPRRVAFSSVSSIERISPATLKRDEWQKCRHRRSDSYIPYWLLLPPSVSFSLTHTQDESLHIDAL